MKSTQAMRDRIRELMGREQDDYDRAVECVLDDLETMLYAAPPKEGPTAGREALEQARQEIVLTIAFLGRDAGSERLQGTIDGLIKRLAKADEAIRSALSSPKERQGPVAWQPIETAPKDGTPIEVCNTRHLSHAPVIVRWTSDGLSEELPEPHWCDAATADGSALYYNQNYFDFWKPTTPLPSAQPGSGK